MVKSRTTCSQERFQREPKSIRCSGMKRITYSPQLLNHLTVHPFPARMAANIPWQILNGRRRQLRVLDPMAGSGTTLIAGRAAGHSTYGVDSDPLAVLVTRVGTADVKASRIEDRARRTLRSARRMRIARRDAYPPKSDKETRKFVRYWFDLEARKQLTALSRSIEDIKDTNTRTFLWCALSRLIITKDAGVSLARDVSHSRPHKSFTRAPFDPFDIFETAVKRVMRACLFQGIQSAPKAQVWQGDARKLPFESESIDLVITSPPYLNAIDYMRGHKLSLIWMGHQINSLRQIRRDSVGAECGSGHADDEIAQIVQVMGSMNKLPERFKRMIQRYVNDMNAVMQEIARVLVQKGQAVIVMGDCTLRGIYIRNSSAIQLLAAKHALTLISERRRHIPDKHRYLPPPRRQSDQPLGKRLRTEVVLGFRK